MASFRIGILTVSDSCYHEGKTDLSGVTLRAVVMKNFPSAVAYYNGVVPDEVIEIRKSLRSMAEDGCDIILTTGGTGFSPRDVTPEATRSLIEKEAPGLAYAMISKSLAITEMAMLSRAVCGIYKNTLIVNLPGSPKAALECFGFIKNALPHAVDLMGDNKTSVVSTHKIVQEVVSKPKISSSQETAESSELPDRSATEGEGSQNNAFKCKSENNESVEKSKSDNVSTAKEISHGSNTTNQEEYTESKVNLSNVASRKRASPYPMLEVEDAVQLIFKESIPTLEIETLPFESSANRVLAEDIYAFENIPPFRASIKDGYAVKSSDGLVNRHIKQVIAAGDQPIEEELQQGQAIRISTGAPVPAGADAVVQVEDTRVIEKSADSIQELVIAINKKPVAGQDIREIGSDVKKGTIVISKFDRITAAHIGVFAMLGKTDVKVFKQPSIGILSTGNELKHPREELRPGQIRDCNKFTLMSVLKKYGYNPMDCGIAVDKANAVKHALAKAFSNNDVIITTGGVSMGEFDILKDVLVEDFDAMIHFGRVNMKPGKPTTFATLQYQGKVQLFFGLPGNPVSCNVTCILFVIPTLRYLERSKVYRFPIVQTSISAPLRNEDPRPEYHRVQVGYSQGKLTAVSTGNQISSRLNSMLGANGLALVKYVQPTQLQSHAFSFDAQALTTQNCTSGFFGQMPTTQSYQGTFVTTELGSTTQNSSIFDTILFDNILNF